jgi:chromosome segregation ATPase
MNREQTTRWARRGVVVVATGAVLAIGVMTVQVAADWRKAAAPLDAAPVSMTSVSDDYTAETGRAADLAGQIDDVAAQISDLKVALITANGSMSDDQANATVLQTQLDTAAVKLKTLQRQLKAAQARLTALNKAAARQAAINRAAGARSTTSGSTAKATPTHHDDGGEGDD